MEYEEEEELSTEIWKSMTLELSTTVVAFQDNY